MARTVTLRPWQHAALEALAASAAPDFLAVATPGAGKTTFALTAARQALAVAPGRRLVVVVPTAHLKVQWARAAVAFDLHLDPEWSAAEGALARDMHGVVTTYQQVAACAGALRSLASGAFVVFDEIHHAADDRAWGDAVRTAFEPAARRLALSGTPFRSDTHAIPFVSYRLEEAVADFEYGYGDALRDGGVVRPVYFPRTDGMMEWSGPDGRLYAHSFDDPLDAARAGQRLRTAYSLDGEWLPHVLGQAHGQLLAIREGQPGAGGLVMATDQDHAKGIGRLLRDRFGVRATVATSDDPEASSRISAFGAGADPWIVAVRMVCEGVDIPRLRVGVYATTVTTELFFRQAVGRLVRWTGGRRGQRSFLYIPDEPRLRARALAIAEQRRHSLRHDDRTAPDQDRSGLVVGDGAGASVGVVDEQGQPLSLFAPISAVPIEGRGGWGGFGRSGSSGSSGGSGGPGGPGGSGADDVAEWVLDDGRVEPIDGAGPTAAHLTIALPPLSAGARVGGPAGGEARAPGPATLREHKKHLRAANAARTRLIARHTGMLHAKVNAELNRVSGVTRISEATVDQLEKRLDKADTWLRQASARRVAG